LLLVISLNDRIPDFISWQKFRLPFTDGGYYEKIKNHYNDTPIGLGGNEPFKLEQVFSNKLRRLESNFDNPLTLGR